MNIQNQFKRMALMGLIMLSTLNLMSQKGQGAKKEETKQRRLETALEKLLAGKRNPSEK